MKVGSSLQKRSVALGGLVALMGVAAVALTPAPAKAFIGVQVGPLAVGVGSTQPPPPVVYTPPPVYTTQPTTVYEEPPVVYTPQYPYYDSYAPTYNDYH